MVNSYIKAILDNSPESIVLIGKNHEVLAYNKTICDVLKQFHLREIKIGDLYYPDFVIDANKQLYLDTFQKAIHGECITVQNLTENENVSIWFEYRMGPVYDDDGSLLGVTLSAKDITTSKKYEMRLIENEDRFRKISDLSPVGILITDNLFRITYANKIANRTFEYEIGEITNFSLPHLIMNLKFSDTKGVTLDNIGFEIETPLFDQEQFDAVTRSGKKINILLSSSSFHSQDKLNYIFIIQDITDAIIKEDLIYQQHKKLRDIAWYQAHIIRAPLSNIMGIVSILDGKTFDIDPLERDAMYQALSQSARELDKVVCDIVKKAE